LVKTGGQFGALLPVLAHQACEQQPGILVRLGGGEARQIGEVVLNIVYLACRLFSATKYLLSFGVDYGEVYGEMEFSSIEPVGDQRGAADGQPNHERLPVSLMFTQA